MKKHAQLLGIAGFVILVFGLLTYALLEADPFYFTQIHLSLGAGLLAASAVLGGFKPLASLSLTRVASKGGGLLFYIAIFLAVLTVFNYIFYRKEIFRYDSTAQKVYTLAPQTQKVLSELGQPIVVRAFYVGGEIDDEVEALLNRFKASSANFGWKVIDPEKRPELVERYKITERDTLHFSFAEEKSERTATVVRNIGEQEITNALIKLTRGESKKVYNIVGHKEGDLTQEGDSGYSALRLAIEGENIQIMPLNLLETGEIPKDASAVLLLAPKAELLPAEQNTIKNYLASVGNALFLNEPRATKTIANLVAPLGLAVGDDIVLDLEIRMFRGPELGVQPVIKDYGQHQVVAGFEEAVLLSTATSARKGENVPSGAEVEELAFTAKSSWAEKKVDQVFSEEPSAAREEEDIKGPVSVAVAFEGPIRAGETSDKSENKSRVIVIGDADFVSNVYLKQLFNRDFFLNALNWVVGEEDAVTLRARTLKESTKRLSNLQFQLMFLFSALLLPEVVILWGFTIWFLRKQ